MLNISGEDLFMNSPSRRRFEAFARLQSTAIAIGESLPIPEIVAIGGQSDGKSSLLEALLGFRFNVCSSEMGTRRPLIVQMVHEPAAHEPRCRLQDEDSAHYGDILPEDSIPEVIRERTVARLHLEGTAVSAKPIVMRAEYAFCPNLTLIDTPGFILKSRAGETASTPDDILAMAKQQCAPSHRLILFLQQSSVEWASSMWVQVINQVDPGFSRTIMVASKFDNRLKEFSERWELEKYLSATGYLPSHVKPFFVALPKERSKSPAGSSAAWRQAIQAVDVEIKEHLQTRIDGGYDEARFGSRIGFGNLKQFLEDELAGRYREAAPNMLALLKTRCDAITADLESVEDRMRRASDVGHLRRVATKYTLRLVAQVDVVMAGFGATDPMRFGMTTEEEIKAYYGRAEPISGESTGNAVSHHPHAKMRLLGAAAFDRCLSEFSAKVAAVTMPVVSQDQVSNMLLSQKSLGYGAGAVERVGEQLARDAARSILAPLIDGLCRRLGGIVRRAYDIAVELKMITNASNCSPQEFKDADSSDVLRPYVAFHAAARAVFGDIIDTLETRGKTSMHRYLHTMTGAYLAATLLRGNNTMLGGPVAGLDDTAGWEEGSVEVAPPLAEVGENKSHEKENVPEKQGRPKERPAFIATQMTVPETPSPDVVAAKAEALAAGNPAGRRMHVIAANRVPCGRNVDVQSPGKGRAAKTARLGSTSGGDYLEVCLYASRVFGAIKLSLANQFSALKATYLEPLHDTLACDMSVTLLGKTDADFMAYFATPEAMEAMKAERDTLKKRLEGLGRMTSEFSDIARTI